MSEMVFVFFPLFLYIYFIQFLIQYINFCTRGTGQFSDALYSILPSKEDSSGCFRRRKNEIIFDFTAKYPQNFRSEFSPAPVFDGSSSCF